MNQQFREKWCNPPKEYRVNAIIHEWHENRQDQMEAIVDYGFGGVVTNPSHRGTYQEFLAAIPEFARIVDELEQRSLGFWLYDEFGYPSGYAGGETLKGHPELEAKGFYMRRYVAYEPRTVCHHLDDESDKIIWAAKYPIDMPVKHQSYVRYADMTAVPFTDTYVETELQAGEAFFVFCVKSAYEGSQCTHNTCSFSRYINIMNPAAVDRFIEEFKRAPYESMLGVMGLLYLSGVRVTNSYFTSNWEEYAPKKLMGANGYMSRKQAQAFNSYIGRMAVMLDGLQPKTDVFVYYGYEDASAKFVPHHTAYFPPGWQADNSARRITELIFEHGHDFLYADAEDVIAAKESGCISGTKVRVIIVPAMDVIDDAALEALLALKKQGVQVFFMERVPVLRVGSDLPVTADLSASEPADVLTALDEMGRDFRAVAEEKLIKAEFQRDGRTVWMLHNGSRKEMEIYLTCPECEVWYPMTGEVCAVAENGAIVVPALQAVFVVI